MSYAWAVDGLADDEDPGPRHDLRCRVQTHPGPVLDPEEDCDCRDDTGHTSFQAGVNRWIARFDSYSAERGRAS